MEHCISKTLFSLVAKEVLVDLKHTLLHCTVNLKSKHSHKVTCICVESICCQFHWALCVWAVFAVRKIRKSQVYQPRAFYHTEASTASARWAAKENVIAVYSTYLKILPPSPIEWSNALASSTFVLGRTVLMLPSLGFFTSSVLRGGVAIPFCFDLVRG